MEDNSDLYAGCGGGCFDGSCTVQVLKGEETVHKKIEELEKGEFVRIAKKNESEEMEWGEVVCVVAVERERSAELIEVIETGLKLTPGHPVRVDGKWKKAKDLFPREEEEVLYRRIRQNRNCVYNLVIGGEGEGEREGEGVVYVNGIECCVLGHGIEGPVISHPFYGSRKEVVKVLGGCEGWDTGFVQVNFSSLREK